MKLVDFLGRVFFKAKQNNSLSTLRNYRSAKQRFLAFCGQEDISIHKMFQHQTLMDFQSYLQARDLHHNTIAFYMRILHAFYTVAVQQKFIRPIEGLFDGIIMTCDDTAKLALTSGQVNRIIKLKLLNHKHLKLSRDMFVLSILLQGISYIDLAHLRRDQRQGNVIVFYRHKTKEKVVLALTPHAIEIIDEHSDPNGVYLLPIMQYTTNAKRSDELYRNALRNYNRHLKSIGALANIEGDISSHTARHTFATLAYNEGAQLSVVSRALGHSNEETTEIYINSFGDKDILEANLMVESLIYQSKDEEEEEEKKEKKEQGGKEEKKKAKKKTGKKAGSQTSGG